VGSQAANKARAQSRSSSSTSAAAEGRKDADGQRWAMARYSRIGGIEVIGVSCREWRVQLGGNGSRLQLAGEARGRSMGDGEASEAV